MALKAGAKPPPPSPGRQGSAISRAFCVAVSKTGVVYATSTHGGGLGRVGGVEEGDLTWELDVEPERRPNIWVCFGI